MKSYYFPGIWLVVLTMAVGPVAADYRDAVTLDTATVVDMGDYLADHDMVYTRLPLALHDGLMIGNGVMGALVYVEAPNRLVFLLGRSDVYSLSEHVFPHRKPIGRFVLETVSAIESRPAIPFRVSIYDGVMTGSLQTENGTIDIEAFIEAEHEVLSVRVRPKDGAATSWRFEGETDPQPTRTRAMPPYDLGPFETAPPKIQTCNGRHLFSLRYDERGSPAGGITVGWDGRSMGDSIIYNATIAYDREQGIDTRKEAVRTLQQASKRGYEKRRRDHVAVWNEFMSRSFVSIPDKKLESFYYIQYYKIRSGTRVGGNLVDLQATWFDPKTPWPAAWHNLNIQIAYWLLNTGNAVELAEPLVRAMQQNQQRFAEMAGPYEGAYALTARTTPDFIPPGPGPSSVLLYEEISEAFKKDYPTPTVFHRATFANFLWLCHNVWLTYRYSMDSKLLDEILYPWLVKGVRLYEHILREGDDGKLHLPVTYSPEYAYAADANYDLAPLRWALGVLLKHAPDRADVTPAQLQTWRDIDSQLIDYPYHPDEGFLIGADKRLEDAHRHYSQLLMIYPFYSVNTDQPGGRDRIRRSVDHWLSFAGDIRATQSRDPISGYSFTAAASMYAAVGDGEQAYEYLDAFVDAYAGGRISRGNTHYFEHAVQSLTQEVSLTGATSLNDMLLQSWGGTLRVFPALPPHWDAAVFSGLRAEGAFLVGAERRAGKLVRLQVRSLAGEPIRVRAGGLNQLLSAAGKVPGIRLIGNNEAILELAAGEEILLIADAAPQALAPVTADNPAEVGFFGLKTNKEE